MWPTNDTFNPWSPFLQAVSTGFNTWNQSNALLDLGERRAAAHNYNVQLAQNYSDIAAASAVSNARQAETRANRERGRVASHITASGAVLGEGTPALLLDNAALQGGLDVQKELYKGVLERAELARRAQQESYAAEVERYNSEVNSNQALLSGIQRTASQFFSPYPGQYSRGV